MQRDYVIQLRPDSDVRAGRFEGRIEHIDSGRSAHFRTIEDLLAFVARSIDLEAACSEETAGSAENLTSL
jgi:hypothetical protein